MQASTAKEFSDIKTWLFVPATRIDRVAKAFASGADAVIVDLEDAVADVDKIQARISISGGFTCQSGIVQRGWHRLRDYRRQEWRGRSRFFGREQWSLLLQN